MPMSLHSPGRESGQEKDRVHAGDEAGASLQAADLSPVRPTQRQGRRAGGLTFLLLMTVERDAHTKRKVGEEIFCLRQARTKCYNAFDGKEKRQPRRSSLHSDR